jgi:hypothetical protein
MGDQLFENDILDLEMWIEECGRTDFSVNFTRQLTPVIWKRNMITEMRYDEENI